MSATAVAQSGPRTLAHFVRASLLGNAGLAIVVFMGGFVIIEPAPYELLLVPLMGAWILSGLRINRYILPLIGLGLLYITGGAIALSQVPSLSEPLVYFATSALLVFSAFFFAAVIAADPERRLQLIVRAYTVGAVLAALVGILTYFAGIEFFTLYDRARGPFQDPNVFGPFLVLPLAYLVYQILTHRLSRMLWQTISALVILLATVLSFSRGAWGMAALAILVVTTLAYINQRKSTARLRVMVYAAIGLVCVIAIVGVLLVLPATSGLFLERAQLVQSYDAGALGRFDRQQIGFLLLFDKPLGLGPFEFGKMLGEDEHNMWIKGFMVYGWLGGISYIALVIWTLIISVPLLFKPRPWQPFVIAAFAAFAGQLLLHNVIDNDHWRHLFLIYGMLWGAYAGERLYQRRLRQPALATYRAPLERARLPA